MLDLDPSLAARPSSSAARSARTYARRRPEETVLHDAVSSHLNAFVDFARERSGRALPKYVLDEFARYLACGDLARGFVRVHCDACGHDALVAFSCKCRGLCPSCSTRRMTGTAALLLDRVLPDIPYRQWVLTVPHSMRLLLAQKPDALTAVQRIVVAEIERAYLATTALEARDAERRSGVVTFVQRFSGSLGLHVHFHCIAADGLFVRDSRSPRPHFVAAEPPTPSSLARVVVRVQTRVLRWLTRHGYANDIPVEDRSNDTPIDDALASCHKTAAAQGTLATLVDAAAPGSAGGEPEHPLQDRASHRRASRWVAHHDGFNLHAGVSVAQGHRTFLERLCRYCARPAFALDRLARLADGRFAYRMKYPLRGKTHRILAPLELLARLASMIPPPRFPLVRYSGVFASGSPLRKYIVPAHPPTRRCCAVHERERRGKDAPDPAHEPPARPTHLAPVDPVLAPPALSNPASRDASATPTPFTNPIWTPSPHSTRIDWASLLRHGLELDALRCARCGARTRILATVLEPARVTRFLDHTDASDRATVPSRAWDPLANPGASSNDR